MNGFECAYEIFGDIVVQTIVLKSRMAISFQEELELIGKSGFNGGRLYFRDFFGLVEGGKVLERYRYIVKETLPEVDTPKERPFVVKFPTGWSSPSVMVVVYSTTVAEAMVKVRGEFPTHCQDKGLISALVQICDFYGEVPAIYHTECPHPGAEEEYVAAKRRENQIALHGILAAIGADENNSVTLGEGVPEPIPKVTDIVQ